MISYEELIKLGENNQNVGEFCEYAVNTYMATAKYRMALDAEAYFDKHNLTIEAFVKWIYTITGRKERDVYSADHRMKTQHFYRKIVQHSNYLMGNGVTFKKAATKKRLGKNFDHMMKKLFQYAQLSGESYGYWNVDHLEVFSYVRNDKHAGFCPIYSEEDGSMCAGIRHRTSTIDNVTITFYDLFEPDGITQYKRTNKDSVFTIVKEKYKYINHVVSNAAEGVLDEFSMNYAGNKIPVIPLYLNDAHISELDGMRESIDTYDLMKNGLANNITDAQEIYWLVKNSGSLNDVKLAQFLQRLKTVHAAAVDSDDKGNGVEAKTVDVPFEARRTLLEMIRTDMYDDWMLLDRRSMSAAEKTTQELDMAYQPQDDYTNDAEFGVLEFIDQLLVLIGVEDEASLKRNKVVNVKEQTEMVMSTASLLPAEILIKKLPFLTIEEAEEAIRIRNEEDMSRFNDMSDQEEDEDTEEEEQPEGDDE